MRDSKNTFRSISLTWPQLTPSSGVGLPVAGLDIGNSIYLDSTFTHDHLVDNLVTTGANKPVLVAHNTHKLVYFSWYRMSADETRKSTVQAVGAIGLWAF